MTLNESLPHELHEQEISCLECSEDPAALLRYLGADLLDVV